MPLPLFSCGTSRGGTTFFTRILSVNKQVKMASDPLLPLFRAFRNEVVLNKIDKDFDISQPLDDYYYYKNKLIIFNTIQQTTLDLKFPHHKLQELRNQIDNRLGLAAKELLGFSKDIKGDTFFDLFKSALTMMNKAFEADDIKWCGFNDNWAIEFSPHLLKNFKDSKLIIIIRDPRAAIASSLNIRKRDSSLGPLVYSFAQCWRKHAAFAYKLINDNKYNDRIFLFRYEDFVTDPRKSLIEISKFLRIKFSNEMLIPNNFRPISGKKWKTYSNFDVPDNQIYKDRIDGWKKNLDTLSIEFIDFICGFEMSLFGYKVNNLNLIMSEERFKSYFEMDCNVSIGWRCKHQDYATEYQNQLKRHNLLSLEPNKISSGDVASYFLFSEVFNAIERSNNYLTSPQCLDQYYNG